MPQLVQPGRMMNAALGGGGASAVLPILVATFGDSRSDLQGGSGGGSDLFDGVTRNLRTTITNQPAWVATAPLFIDDIALTCNGGCSGEETGTWNSGARLSGRTYASVIALTWDIIVIQYGTNDVQNHVVDTTTRDSQAAATIVNLKALITALLTTGRKVVFQTTMQRTSAAFAANQALRQACTDYINYGNGGAIDGMVPWCQAQSQYGTQLYVHDVQSLINAGGVSTGAYADGNLLGDGTHPSYQGARLLANSFKTLLRTIYTDRGSLAIYRSTGPNLIPTASATYYGGEVLSHCSKSAIVYGTDGSGRAYGETTITPDNAAVGSYKFELLADVGTNGGRTPAGGTFVANDLIMPRTLLTLDDGAGNPATSVNNVVHFVFCSYIGGTPGLQQIQNGQNAQGGIQHTLADLTGQYYNLPLKMTGDSSLIGAPAAGNGLRSFIQIYFPITSTPFRVRWTTPEMRKVV